MGTNTNRLGPLRELALDQLLPQDSSRTSTRPNKRPHSPASPNLFSPAKRRILAQEGVFSPEKTVKSPLSSDSQGRFAPSHFHDLLSGPGSPARKLDFGTPSQSLGGVIVPSIRLFAGNFEDPVDTTPTHVASTSSARLQPSPIYLQKTVNDVEDFLQLESGSTSTLKALPPSIHYPGFDVWRDPDDDASHSTSISGNASTILPIPSTKSRDLEDKENLPPGKKSKKSHTSPGASNELLKDALLSPERMRCEVERLRMVKSTPLALSPYRCASRTPTSRLTGLEITPGRAVNCDKEELKRRRDMLVSEVDGEDDEDDEEL